MEMKVTPMKKIFCPTCKHRLDAAVDSNITVDGMRSPRPDDLAFCFNCAEFSILNSDLTLRIVDKNDLDKLSENDINKFSKIREDLIKWITHGTKH